VTAWMAVAGSGLIPRKATLELPMLPAARAPRRLPRSRTRVATPLSDADGDEQPPGRCDDPRCSTGQNRFRSLSRARFRLAARLLAVDLAADTAARMTCAPVPEMLAPNAVSVRRKRVVRRRRDRRSIASGRRSQQSTVCVDRGNSRRTRSMARLSCRQFVGWAALGSNQAPPVCKNSGSL
jgi:hypothetical protein